MRRRFDEEDVVSGGAGGAVVVHDYVAGVSVPLEVGESYTMSGYNWAQSGLFAIEFNEVGASVSISDGWWVHYWRYASTEVKFSDLNNYTVRAITSLCANAFVTWVGCYGFTPEPGLMEINKQTITRLA
jgi:hypothetical protein